MKLDRRWLLLLVGLIIVFLVDFPILTVALNSFRTTENILSSQNILPTEPTLANYFYINTRTHFWAFLLNSGIVASASTALGIVLAALAGFAISRFQARMLGLYNQALLVVQMFPLILAIIPLFILFRRLSLVNNFIPVILVYTVTQLPFSTWMLRSYFDSIPKELDEAAKVDGCSPLRGFLQIVLPLAAPGIAAVAIFSFLFSYNEFFISSVFLRDESLMTMPVGIQSFMQQYSADWGSLMASATLAMVPTLILFLFIQKYMISGATAGAVKG
ncbi:MAG TPA: carbohydrate ABC transporter permease [Candidatus Angelobacter sp.]|nr:carbohydrate ABC transporter permease [Candidatus Angelobacter sp.]